MIKISLTKKDGLYQTVNYRLSPRKIFLISRMIEYMGKNGQWSPVVKIRRDINILQIREKWFIAHRI